MLSASTILPFEKDPTIIRNLDQFAAENKHIKFYLGGRGSLEYTKNHPLRTIIVSDVIDEIEDLVNGKDPF